MNSGLQCLSNTIELTKFFLFDLYKQDINTDNPLGLEGRLATAFSELMAEMWLDKDRRTAPH
jgi:ubiquitin carboxyl-terminal hydrolase 4/11/15